MFIIILFLALLPAALLWLYVWKKDPNKEPTGQLVKATLLGAVICIPVAVWEVIVSEIFLDGADEATSVLGVLVDAFMVAAIPEECAKLLVLWLFLRKNRNYDEHFDGIIYAVCVGLGFAAVENVFYVMDDEDWLFVAIFRGLLSVPGHYNKFVPRGVPHAALFGADGKLVKMDHPGRLYQEVAKLCDALKKAETAEK